MVREVEVIKEVPVEKIVIREVIVEIPVSDEVEGRSVSDPAEAVEEAAIAEVAPSLVGTEIDVRWNGLDPVSQRAALDEAAKFEDETGIVIRADFSDWASSFQKITTGFAAGTAPDIWQAGGLWTPVLASSGGTLFLDEFVRGWEEWPDWYPVARKDVEYEGHVHGIPYRLNYRGNPVIRESYFEATGLPATPPTTWDELNEVSEQLTLGDGNRWNLAGFNVQHSTQVYEDWLIQAGGSHFNANLRRPTNDTDEGFAALSQHVRHRLVSRVMPPEGVDSGIPNLQAFCAGRVSIQQLWPGDVANCKINIPDVFADMLVGEPFSGPEAQGLQLYVDKYMTYKLTRSPDAVFAVLEWLSPVEINYAINVESRFSMPCRVAAESLPIYQTSPWSEFMMNWRFGRQRPVVADHFDVQPAMGRWVEKAALGDVSVREALQGMDAEVESSMA